MVAALCAVLLALAPTTAVARAWSDVPAGSELAAALEQLEKKGAVVASDTFAPDAPLTRAAAAKMLAAPFLPQPYIAHFLGDTSYGDVPADAWYAPFVEAARQSGAWEAVGGGAFFHPEAPITTDAFATALRALSRRAGPADVVAGYPATVRRGDAAVAVYRLLIRPDYDTTPPSPWPPPQMPQLLRACKTLVRGVFVFPLSEPKAGELRAKS